MSQLFEVTAADVVPTKDDWYTPRWLFDAAGIIFDMDVAAPVAAEFRTCPARCYLTPVEDGLTHPWAGMIWCNPPYSRAAPWADRFARHDDGMILLPAMKRGSGLRAALRAADAITLLELDFGRPDGTTGQLPVLLLLAARGAAAVAGLARVAAADRYMQGSYYLAGRPA